MHPWIVHGLSMDIHVRCPWTHIMRELEMREHRHPLLARPRAAAPLFFFRLVPFLRLPMLVLLVRCEGHARL